LKKRLYGGTHSIYLVSNVALIEIAPKKTFPKYEFQDSKCHFIFKKLANFPFEPTFDENNFPYTTFFNFFIFHNPL
jgi:hypothetical protein